MSPVKYVSRDPATDRLVAEFTRLGGVIFDPLRAGSMPGRASSSIALPGGKNDGRRRSATRSDYRSPSTHWIDEPYCDAPERSTTFQTPPFAAGALMPFTSTTICSHPASSVAYGYAAMSR